MRKFRRLPLILLGLMALSSAGVFAEERSISITRKDGREAYFCAASSCFEPGELQRRYDAKQRYIQNHACKTATPASNRHCSEEHETLQAIRQCANNYCSAARCLKKDVATGRCWDSVFRR